MPASTSGPLASFMAALITNTAAARTDIACPVHSRFVITLHPLERAALRGDADYLPVYGAADGAPSPV